MNVKWILVPLLILAVAIPARALTQPQQHDPYCPNTDAPVATMKATVTKSPDKVTAQMGQEATAIYKAYEQCGSHYLQKRDSGKYVYAIAQAANMYDFAVHAYYKTHQVADARSAAEDGIRSIESALSQPPSRTLTHFRQDLKQELMALKGYLSQLPH